MSDDLKGEEYYRRAFGDEVCKNVQVMARQGAMESENKKLRETFKSLMEERKKLTEELKDYKAKLVQSEKDKDDIMHTKDEQIKNLQEMMKEEASVAEDTLRKKMFQKDQEIN